LTLNVLQKGTSDNILGHGVVDNVELTCIPKCVGINSLPTRWSGGA
jgi:hypothetical protein